MRSAGITNPCCRGGPWGTLYRPSWAVGTTRRRGSWGPARWWSATVGGHADPSHPHRRGRGRSRRRRVRRTGRSPGRRVHGCAHVAGHLGRRAATVARPDGDRVRRTGVRRRAARVADGAAAAGAAAQRRRHGHGRRTRGGAVRTDRRDLRRQLDRCVDAGEPGDPAGDGGEPAAADGHHRRGGRPGLARRGAAGSRSVGAGDGADHDGGGDLPDGTGAWPGAPRARRHRRLRPPTWT